MHIQTKLTEDPPNPTSPKRSYLLLRGRNPFLLSKPYRFKKLPRMYKKAFVFNTCGPCDTHPQQVDLGGVGWGVP